MGVSQYSIGYFQVPSLGYFEVVQVSLLPVLPKIPSKLDIFCYLMIFKNESSQVLNKCRVAGGYGARY